MILPTLILHMENTQIQNVQLQTASSFLDITEM